jgi:hypothetical protein
MEPPEAGCVPDEAKNSAPAQTLGGGLLSQRSGKNYFEISPDHVKGMQSAFDQLPGKHVDVRKIRVFVDAKVKVPYTVGTDVFLNPEFAYGPADILLYTMLHEGTHVIQFDRIGLKALYERRAIEKQTAANQGVDMYKTPAPPPGTPLTQLDVVDSRYTIESVASYVGRELLKSRATYGF